MAPRRLLLLVAAACSLLAASTPTHAARDLPAAAGRPTAPRTVGDAAVLRGSSPSSIHSAVLPANDAGATPRAVDFHGAHRVAAADVGLVVPPHVIEDPTVLANGTDDDPAAAQRYDVTVIFRATRRMGPPRLRYYVVPADAYVRIFHASAAPSPAAVGDDAEDVVTNVFFVVVVTLTVVSLVFFGCALICGPVNAEEARSGGGGAVPKKKAGVNSKKKKKAGSVDLVQVRAVKQARGRGGN